MRVLTRQEWNEIIQQVNDLRQNPPAETDCEALDPIDEVDPNHIWTFGDIEEVQNALKEMCEDIEFSEVGPKWKESVVQEIYDAMGQAWCDCEDDDDDEPCDEDIIAAEHGATFMILSCCPSTIQCPGDEGETLLIRDSINGMQFGQTGIFLRVWRVFRRIYNNGIQTGLVQMASGVLSCQGILTYTGSATMSTKCGTFCGCCADCANPGSCSEFPFFCADMRAICESQQAANAFCADWVVVIDTSNAFCKLEDDPCP